MNKQININPLHLYAPFISNDMVTEYENNETIMNIIDEKKYELPEGHGSYNYTQYLNMANKLIKCDYNDVKKYGLNDNEIKYLSQSIDHACIIVKNHNDVNLDNYNDIIRYINDPLRTSCKTYFLFEMEGRKEMLKNIKCLFTDEEITSFFDSLIYHQMHKLMYCLFEAGYRPNFKICENNYYEYIRKHAMPDEILYHLVTTTDIVKKYDMTIQEIALLTINTNDYQINENIFKYSTKISDNFVKKITKGYYHIEETDMLVWSPVLYSCWTDDAFVEFLEKVRKFGLGQKIKNFYSLEQFAINMGPKSRFQWKCIMSKL